MKKNLNLVNQKIFLKACHFPDVSALIASAGTFNNDIFLLLNTE